MRVITTHEVKGAETGLQVAAVDAPGSGGAHHFYLITGFNNQTNPSAQFRENNTRVYFQNGGIPDNGINGVTIEALLAICQDRLECFQAGPFSSEANECALSHIEAAIYHLQERTKDRIRRNVEGKEVV